MKIKFNKTEIIFNNYYNQIKLIKIIYKIQFKTLNMKFQAFYMHNYFHKE